MKLSISNIAWENENDSVMYNEMKKLGYLSLEIAPTRIFPFNPYNKLKDAKKWSEQLRESYSISICSLQSIWYGRKEQIFNSQREREILVEYTKRAIEFAKVVGASNLVFGCPQNRITKSVDDIKVSLDFFSRIADYAYSCETVLALEANPVIYNTNFINTTQEALELIKAVNHRGFMLNLDLGTMIFNQEKTEQIKKEFKYVNHIHISEPGLIPLEKNPLLLEIRTIMEENRYNKFISIEMKNGLKPRDIVSIMNDVKVWMNA